MLRHFKINIQPRAKELGATLLNVVEAFFFNYLRQKFIILSAYTITTMIELPFLL